MCHFQVLLAQDKWWLQLWKPFLPCKTVLGPCPPSPQPHLDTLPAQPHKLSFSPFPSAAQIIHPCFHLPSTSSDSPSQPQGFTLLSQERSPTQPCLTFTAGMDQRDGGSHTRQGEHLPSLPPSATHSSHPQPIQAWSSLPGGVTRGDFDRCF